MNCALVELVGLESRWKLGVGVKIKSCMLILFFLSYVLLSFFAMDAPLEERKLQLISKNDFLCDETIVDLEFDTDDKLIAASALNLLGKRK